VRAAARHQRKKAERLASGGHNRKEPWECFCLARCEMRDGEKIWIHNEEASA